MRICSGPSFRTFLQCYLVAFPSTDHQGNGCGDFDARKIIVPKLCRMNTLWSYIPVRPAVGIPMHAGHTELRHYIRWHSRLDTIDIECFREAPLGTYLGILGIGD